MTAGMPGEDPGWGKPHEIFLSLVPLLGRRQLARARSSLALTRKLFLAFVTALLLFGVVLLLMDLGGEPGAPPALGVRSAVIGVVLVGLGSVTISFRIGGRLKCGTSGELLTRYRERFFLRIALSEIPALFGWAASILCENPAPYFAGMALALVGFAGLAPTRANLQRDDEHLRAGGCATSLYEALLLPPAGRAAPPDPA